MVDEEEPIPVDGVSQRPQAEDVPQQPDPIEESDEADLGDPPIDAEAEVAEAMVEPEPVEPDVPEDAEPEVDIEEEAAQEGDDSDEDFSDLNVGKSMIGDVEELFEDDDEDDPKPLWVQGGEDFDAVGGNAALVSSDEEEPDPAMFEPATVRIGYNASDVTGSFNGVELTPCDSSGAMTGDAVVTAKLPYGTWTMANGTKVEANTLWYYQESSDETPYILGGPPHTCICDERKQGNYLEVKTFDVIGMTTGTVSDWVAKAAIMPVGTATGDILTWDNTGGNWTILSLGAMYEPMQQLSSGLIGYGPVKAE